MKKISAILFYLLISAAAFAQIPSTIIADEAGSKFNTAELLDGETPVVISFWAMTCKPCITELDAISELYPDWIEDVNFKMVAVSIDDNRFTTKARSFAQGRGWSDFILLYDKNQDFARALNVSVTPQIFVFDAKGKIIYSHTGYTPGSEESIYKALHETQK